MNFYVCELLISLGSAFSSVSTPADSPWRKRSVWFDQLVDESHSASYLVDDLFSSGHGVDTCSEAISSWICQLNCMFFVLGTKKSKNRPKSLMIVSLTSTFHNCHWEERLENPRLLPGYFIRLGQVFELVEQVVVDVVSGQWSDLGVRLHRVAVF